MWDEKKVEATVHVCVEGTCRRTKPPASPDCTVRDVDDMIVNILETLLSSSIVASDFLLRRALSGIASVVVVKEFVLMLHVLSRRSCGLPDLSCVTYTTILTTIVSTTSYYSYLVAQIA